MHLMTEKKEELKKLANHIRALKFSRKGGKPQNELWDICYEIGKAKRQFRHEHIAYCLVRGRTYEQIETPAKHNKPDWKLIDSLKEKLQKKVDESNAEWQLIHPKKEVSNG